MVQKSFSWRTARLPNSILILVITFHFASCGGSKSERDSTVTDDADASESKVPEDVYRNIIPLHQLSINNDLEALGDLSDRLFGEFHQKRASYYIIDDPSIYIGSSRVRTLTLYFVDNVLLKKKYELVSDIDRELLQSYGNCSFEPLTSTADSVVQILPSILTPEKTIDPSIDSYSLKWRKEYMRITYQNDRRGEEPVLVLTEEHIHYGSLLQKAEYDL